MTPKLKTVLIVDDDEGMRDTLTAILKREYRVLRVASGEAALPVLNREDVDLILLDVRLPGISGFEVLRIVKENYSLIEVIMISAISEIETAVQAMKHGAYHYVTKEFDYDQLRSLVRNAERTPGSQSAGDDAVGAGGGSERARVRRRTEQERRATSSISCTRWRSCPRRFSSSAKAAPAKSCWRG